MNRWAYTPVKLGKSHVRVCLVQNTPSPLAQDPHHLLRRRALPPVHLRSDLQGRVDDRVDVVPLTREWVARSSSGKRSAPLGISPLECFFQIPPNIRSSPWCLFIAQRSRDSLPSSESRSCGGLDGVSGIFGGGRCRQIGHLLQQRLLVPRVLCLSEPPDVGDVLLLHVPRCLRGHPAPGGAEQPPLQSLPEITWPCRHLQGLEGVVKHPCLIGVLGALFASCAS